MSYAAWRVPRHTRRLLILVAPVGAYCALLAVDALHSFAHASSLRELAAYGFAAFTALMFLVMGALVWLYARNRRVGQLLFASSCATLLPLTLETATVKGDRLLLAISSAGSSLALLLFALLLLHFPKDFFALVSQARSPAGRSPLHSHALQGYVAVATTFCLLAVLFAGFHIGAAPPPFWLESCYNLYNVGILAGIGITIIVSYRRTSTLRERQQQRLLVWGIILSFGPLFLLTVVPGTLQHLLHLVPVDGQFSAVSLVLLPLSLGYSILRYQLLVFDTYVRRVVAGVVGVVCLAVLVYVAQGALKSLEPSLSGTPSSVVVVALVAVLAPVVWLLAKRGTEQFFFEEVIHSRRIFTPATIGEQVLTQEEVARSLLSAAKQTFETPDVCLFVLSEDASTYQLCPAPEDERIGEVSPAFAQDVMRALLPSAASGMSLSLSAETPAATSIATSKRPLLLREVVGRDEQAAGLTRFLNTEGQQNGMNVLLAPIRSNGKMIGILVLGPRGDRHLYAGPDFEIVRALLGQFSPLLETARVTQTLRTTNAQLREANIQLRDAYEQQKDLDRLKDQLIINVNHELRTPLSEAIGYLALLDESGGDLDPATRALFVKNAVHGCNELLELSNTILNAAQSSKAPQRTFLEVVPLALIVREELDHLDPRLIQAYRIEQQIAEHIQVRADGQVLRQVLRNLLSNALKYSPPQTTVTVSADVEDQHTPSDSPVVRVCVKDEGPGIPADELPLLFGKFVRLQRDLSGSIRGTGLGLSICKQMVEAMGGRIWVESTGIPGQGSTFQFTLPNGQAQNGQAQTNTAPETAMVLM